MTTLYDVLGLSRLATQQQVELAYNQNIEAITSVSNNASLEQNSIRTKAVKEAYSILSSPVRRLNYDASLRLKEQVTYQIIEKPPTPWEKIAIVLLIIVAAGFYYIHIQNKAQKERIALDIQQAKALVERAEQEVLAEQARAEQIRIDTQRQADYRRESEMNRARYDGRMISERNRQIEEQAERERKREAQLAAADAVNEERKAKSKNASEAAAMRRALQMPVGQPNYYRNTPGGTIHNR